MLFHALTREDRTHINTAITLYAGTLHDCFCANTRKVSLSTTFTLYARRTSQDCSMPSHIKLISTLLSRRTHEERYKIVSVISHAKFVSRPFSRYYARSIIRHKPRRQQHHNGRLGREKSSSSNPHDEKAYTRCYMQRGRWRIGRLGRWQSFSSINHDDKIYTRCYMQPGRRRIGFSAAWLGENVSIR